jgi:alcohol dehydrogenase (NADP+)
MVSHGNPASALSGTLKELGLDYLDLYLMHFPVGTVGLDYVAVGHKFISFLSSIRGPHREADNGQTYQKMEKLVNPSQGTRYIGIANHSPTMVDAILKAATIKPKVHQFEGHPYLRQDDFVKFNFERNITVVNYAPLGNTSPTYASTGASAPKLLTNKVIVEIAKARGCAPAQVVLTWDMQRKVIVIPKAIKKDHQLENYAAQEKCKLTDEDVAKIQGMQYKIRMLSYPCAMAANACFTGL